jgi:hypothetical protein
MAKRGVRRVRVVRNMRDVYGHSRLEAAFVEVPRDWSRALVSLIKLSDEHRHAGLLVTNVGPVSPGAVAGIARGDVLLRYDSVQLDSADTLTRRTMRPVHGDEASRHVVIEAVRGEVEMNFKVAGGKLGITVSPLLHRFGPWRRKPTSPISKLEQSLPLGSNGSVFIDVPGELVWQVMLLGNLLQRRDNPKQRRKVKALLLTAALAA